jgi:hypothetical protein
MPYIFPKRRLRDEDVLDPVELNEDFIPAAELYSGNLDRHNFRSSVDIAPKSDNANAKSGYFNHYNTSTNSDPDFGNHTATFQFPTSDDANAFVVPGSMGWSTITEMSLTNIKTGVSLLWINAWLQYVWLGFYKSQSSTVYAQNAYSQNESDHGLPKLPCAIQFAIKVDGVVLENTVTGHSNPYHRTCQPWSWVTTRSNVLTGGAASSGFPGPATEYDGGIAGNGPELMPIRVGAYVPVSPGTHTVEVVVRRLRPTSPVSQMKFRIDNLTAWSEVDEPDAIGIYNRKLHVTEIPTLPRATTSFDSVEVTTLDTEDTISAASLGTNAIDKVRDKLNDVQEGALARGALTNAHLKSGVVAKSGQDTSSTGQITPSTAQSLRCKYPGFGTATFATSPASGTGWFALDDGAGNQLRTSSFLSVKTRDPGYLIILANVLVTRVGFEGSTSLVRNNTALAGAFCIGYRYDNGGSSALDVAPSTTCFVNNYNIFGATHDTSDTDNKKYRSWPAAEQVDVALMHVIDLTDPSSHSVENYNFFQVYASLCTAEPDRTLRWKYGNISYLYLRA